MATLHDDQSTAPGPGGGQPQAAAEPAAAQPTAPGAGGENDAVHSFRLSGHPDGFRFNGVYTADGRYGQHPLYRHTNGKAVLYFAPRNTVGRRMNWVVTGNFSEW